MLYRWFIACTYETSSLSYIRINRQHSHQLYRRIREFVASTRRPDDGRRTKPQRKFGTHMKFLSSSFFLNSFLAFPFQKYQETIEVSKKRLRTYLYRTPHSFTALNDEIVHVCLCFVCPCLHLATRRLKNYKNYCKEIAPWKSASHVSWFFPFAVTNIRSYLFPSPPLFKY